MRQDINLETSQIRNNISHYYVHKEAEPMSARSYVRLSVGQKVATYNVLWSYINYVLTRDMGTIFSDSWPVCPKTIFQFSSEAKIILLPCQNIVASLDAGINQKQNSNRIFDPE